MRIHQDIELGVATNTGQVRSTNEDDYLIVAPHDPARVARAGRLFAVADGMGGVTGGSEASRAAVRSLGGAFLDEGVPDAEERMRAGFAGACRVVFELSKESPRLSEMGTTLTALNLIGDRAVIGHVGDSRCLLWRKGRLAQLTDDHAMTEPRNLLTRCIGAGQASEEVDIVTVEVREGDLFVLMTDGVWNTMDEGLIAQALRAGAPQHSADRLIEIANENGGPDNCTALCVQVRRVRGEPGALREVDLPGDEAPRHPVVRGPVRRLVPPRWPLCVLALGVVLGGLAAAKLLYGVDVLRRAVELFR